MVKIVELTREARQRIIITISCPLQVGGCSIRSNRASAFMSACIWTIGIVVGIIIGSFVLNFGFRGFINILQEIKHGI